MGRAGSGEWRAIGAGEDRLCTAVRQAHCAGTLTALRSGVFHRPATGRAPRSVAPRDRRSSLRGSRLQRRPEPADAATRAPLGALLLGGLLDTCRMVRAAPGLSQLPA